MRKLYLIFLCNFLLCACSDSLSSKSSTEESEATFTERQVEKDIAEHTKRTQTQKVGGLVTDIIYKKSSAEIHFVKPEGTTHLVFQNIEAPTPGQKFCSTYLPAFIKSPQVSPIVQESDVVSMQVKTAQSIAACKCYFKSFFTAGFSRLTVGFLSPELRIRNIKNPHCGLDFDDAIIFKSLTDIDDFCQKDPLKNPESQQAHVDCLINLHRSTR